VDLRIADGLTTKPTQYAARVGSTDKGLTNPGTGIFHHSVRPEQRPIDILV